MILARNIQVIINNSLGLSDPGVIICLQAFSRALKKLNLDPRKAFEVLSRYKNSYISKADFLQGLEGMQLKVTKDDILALFNSLDKNRTNTIDKEDFLQGMAYATQTTREKPKILGKSLTNAKIMKTLKK